MGGLTPGALPMTGEYLVGEPWQVLWAWGAVLAWGALVGVVWRGDRRRWGPWLMVAGSAGGLGWWLSAQIQCVEVSPAGVWNLRAPLGFSVGVLPADEPRRLWVAPDGTTSLERRSGRVLRLGPRGAEILGYVAGACVPHFVEAGQIYEWHRTAPEGPRCARAAAQPGLSVFAPWSGDGWWYPAEVLRWRREGIWVRFRDGAQEPCGAEEVRPFEAPKGAVQVDWQGQGAYFPAQVEWGRDERVRVRYDDGSLDTVRLEQLRFQ